MYRMSVEQGSTLFFVYVPESCGAQDSSKNLSFMSNKKSSEELQSRREFFKKAAKAALPVVGAVVLSSLPVLKSEAATGCDFSCDYGCQSTCYGDCKSGCQQGCYRGCRNTCDGTCSGVCAKQAYA